ncbi:MAG: phosphoenolpyruvate--protein phosphotransferase [Arenicellales bacterium]
MLALHGTGVGAGIAVGRARIINRTSDKITQYPIAQEHVQKEIERLEKGIETAQHSLFELGKQFGKEVPEEVRALLEAHSLMLKDPLILQESSRLISEQWINAEFALNQYGTRLERVFEQIQDPYLSSKSVDVAQVIQRVLGAMTDSQEAIGGQPEGTYDGEIIIVNDLTPADTIELRKHRIIGFVTKLGGPTSHTAILARSMKIPAIVGMHGSVGYLRTGDLLIIDGKRGVILASPDNRALAAYQRRREKIIRRTQALETLRDAESVSLDGQRIMLMSNVELPDEVSYSVKQNAEGVGLYRTEFMFMNREQMPDEEEQVEVYKQVLEKSDCPVTIRTLDLGADKQVDGGRSADNQSTNPALGLRGIRLCLHDLGLFKPQLRAIYRASIFGRARMMVPMISNVEELDQLFRLIDEVKQELAEQNYPFDSELQVGGMIEVPAAAIAADIFARKLDFLSIGTNDLIQYTLAIDRIDDEVNYLYDPIHPSILRLIKNVIDAGLDAGVPVSMCGEMAGDPAYTRILLALGLREFSMDPAGLLEIKQIIRRSDVSQLKLSLPKFMSATEPEKLRQQLVELNR